MFFKREERSFYGLCWGKTFGSNHFGREICFSAYCHVFAATIFLGTFWYERRGLNSNITFVFLTVCFSTGSFAKSLLGLPLFETVHFLPNDRLVLPNFVHQKVSDFFVFFFGFFGQIWVIGYFFIFSVPLIFFLYFFFIKLKNFPNI